MNSIQIETIANRLYMSRSHAADEGEWMDMR